MFHREQSQFCRYGRLSLYSWIQVSIPNSNYLCLLSKSSIFHQAKVAFEASNSRTVYRIYWLLLLFAVKLCQQLVSGKEGEMRRRRVFDTKWTFSLEFFGKRNFFFSSGNLLANCCFIDSLINGPKDPSSPPPPPH